MWLSPCKRCRRAPFGGRFQLARTGATVPRGEVYALVQLLMLAEPMAIIKYVTDNLGLSNIF